MMMMIMIMILMINDDNDDDDDNTNEDNYSNDDDDDDYDDDDDPALFIFERAVHDVALLFFPTFTSCWRSCCDKARHHEKNTIWYDTGVCFLKTHLRGGRPSGK